MGLVLAALVLWGNPDAVTPRWDAPPECPEQTVVEQWIDRLMLAGVEDVPNWQGRVEASDDAGFVLTLTVSGRPRTLVDSECEKLAVAAALVIAVAADPVAVADAIEDESPPPEPASAVLEQTQGPRPPEPAPAPASIDPPPRRTAPPRDPVPGLCGVVSGAIGAELAVLPKPGFAASVGAGVLWSWLRLEFVGLVSTPRDVAASDPNFGARAAVAGGQVRGCGIVRADPVEVPLCLAGEVGGVWARGFGPTIEPQARVQPWAAVVPSLGVTRWLSKRVGMEARISVPVGLYKPAVHLEGLDLDVFRASSVGARLWVGPVVRFP